ncbi:MAG: hypothetical protein FWF32_01370 [Endomicrobia bacterium]|nr:hypothetical protein [Endomicrobiia bacterium]
MKNVFGCIVISFIMAVCIVFVSCSSAEKNVKGGSSLSDERGKHESSNSSLFAKARRYYLDGKIDKAELTLNKILLSNPGDYKAAELKNKILILKEKMFVFVRDTADEYMFKADIAFKDKNFYEGLLFYKKAVDLMPENHDVQKYKAIVADINDEALKYLPEDRKKFMDSLEAFQAENLKKTEKIVKKLSKKYKSMDRFNEMMDSYKAMIIYSDANATKNFYKNALNYFKKGEIDMAQTYIDDALELDPKNPDFVFLSEQINLEQK